MNETPEQQKAPDDLDERTAAVIEAAGKMTKGKWEYEDSEGYGVCRIRCNHTTLMHSIGDSAETEDNTHGIITLHNDAPGLLTEWQKRCAAEKARADKAEAELAVFRKPRPYYPLEGLGEYD